MRNRSSVEGEAVGFVGVSRGVEPALLTAARYDGPAAVVGYSGSGFAHSGLTEDYESAGPESAWLDDGDPIVGPEAGRRFDAALDAAFDDGSDDRNATTTPTESRSEDATTRSGTETTTGAETTATGTTTREDGSRDEREIQQRVDRLAAELGDTVEEVTLPVEQIDGPVLLSTGAADELWAAPVYSEFAIRRLSDGDHGHPYEHRSYEGCGHVHHLPYRAYDGYATRDSLGGSPAANARAANDVWPVTLDYLRRGLRER